MGSANQCQIFEPEVSYFNLRPYLSALMKSVEGVLYQLSVLGDRNDFTGRCSNRNNVNKGGSLLILQLDV